MHAGPPPPCLPCLPLIYGRGGEAELLILLAPGCTIPRSSVTNMASSVEAAASDVEPDPKRRKLLDAGGPIEDDETARQKMRDAEVYERGVDGTYEEYDGFDPDNVGDVKSMYEEDEDADDDDTITPMGYFAMKGDLPMMRWLYVNGADTRYEDVAVYFPMWLAVANGEVEVCKWLFAHGAAKDIKRRNHNGHSPLSATFESIRRDLSRWLILSGALCKDDGSGKLDVEIMQNDLGITFRLARERKALLEWATDLHRPRTSFLLFLSGALSAPQNATSTSKFSPALRLMGGNPGIFETIGAYVGIHIGRDARIIRQLTEMLPKLIAEFHFDDDSSGESSSDEPSSDA